MFGIDDLLLGGLISGGLNAAGGIVGGIAAGDARGQALALQKQALERLQAIKTPEAEQLRIALEKYTLAGQIAPEMQQIIDSGPSEMKNISTDPRLKDAQMSALTKLQSLGTTGLRPEDLAALGQVRSQTEQDENARQQSILQNMQSRGQGGSGAELAARLTSSQGSANRSAQAGLNIAGLASQNALQALMNAGQLGSSIQSQDFNQKAQVASASDIINRYNAMNRQQVLGQNVAGRNAAQAQNLSNTQAINNANVDTANKQEVANKGIPQQQFQNELSKQQASANAASGAASGLNAAGDRTAQMWQGLGSGLGQGVAAGAAYQQNKDYLDYLKTKK